MKNKKMLISNILIILAGAISIVFNIIDGLGDTVNLIVFILSCVVVVLTLVDIILEIKKNKKKEQNNQDK